MGTGQAFVKWLRPAGCAVFLIFGIAFSISLFTAKGTPVAGYSAPEDSSYYMEHLEELCQELRENLFPKLQVEVTAQLSEDGNRVMVLSSSREDLHTVRLALIYYYDEELFEFSELS